MLCCVVTCDRLGDRLGRNAMDGVRLLLAPILSANTKFDLEGDEASPDKRRFRRRRPPLRLVDHRVTSHQTVRLVASCSQPQAEERSRTNIRPNPPTVSVLVCSGIRGMLRDPSSMTSMRME